MLIDKHVNKKQKLIVLLFTFHIFHRCPMTGTYIFVKYETEHIKLINVS